MDAITGYIDHMFRALPGTPEVRRAKQELAQMSEDRYHELRAEGASENEAVGRVIAQFGNLDEVADELGIRAELDSSIAEPVRFSDDEAERFLQVRRRGARLIAGGVLVALAGVSALIGFANDAIVLRAGESIRFTGEPLGILLFFVSAAIAVGMFIVAGVSMGRYARDEGKAIQLGPDTAEHYRKLREAGTMRFALGLAGGVAIILLSVAAAAVAGAFREEAVEVAGVIGMLLGIGVGAGVLILTSMGRGALDRLTSEGDYTPEKLAEQLREDETFGRFAGPYWMLAVVVYLAWSFIGDAWERSWIVWPIAGVLFALLAATATAFRPAKPRR